MGQSDGTFGLMEFSKRKWGWYLTLISADHFKVKLLYFKKEKECSMQRHFNRRELWCFIFGRGIFSRIMKIGAVLKVPVIKGDHRFVEIEEWHQYYAIDPTLVLEIQTGYCIENDIERKS